MLFVFYVCYLSRSAMIQLAAMIQLDSAEEQKYPHSDVNLDQHVSVNFAGEPGYSLDYYEDPIS